MNTLPKPIVVMLCPKCDEITNVLKDRAGQYCAKCRRSPEDLQRLLTNINIRAKLEA